MGWGGLAAEERIERLTLLCGLAGAVALGAWRGPAWGLGFDLGAGLSWVNFRWLKLGMYAMTAAMAGGASGRGRSRYWLRLALVGAALCVIFVVHRTAFIAALLGLLSASAAILLEAGYEVARAAARER